MRSDTASLIALALSACVGVSAQQMGGGRAAPRTSPRAEVDVPTPALSFRDVAAEWGVTHDNVYGGIDGKRFILEMTGNGAAIFDFDRDGRPDVLFVNGTRLGEDAPPGAYLYRNLGDGVFEDVTDRSGLTRRGWGQGACAGDYDNDGYTDLLITYYGHNALYRNRGGNSFEEVTGAAGMPVDGDRWGSGCAFLDYDRDGLLDVFVANYVRFDSRQLERPDAGGDCSWRGLKVFCGPRGLPGGSNALYRNVGDGRFEDVSRSAGILLADEAHYGLGATVADFDDDGHPDIYVACDSTPSILYHNRGDGTFEDVAVPAGVAYGAEGQEEGSMGVAAGDYDNAGLTDLAVSNFIDETPTLYRNEGDLFFTDETYAAGLGVETKRVGWGIALLDVDNDGWKDVFIANGHIYPELRGADVGETFAQSKLLFWNLRNGAFREVSRVAGAALTRPRVARGAAVGDLDEDGSLEIVVVNMNGAPSIYKQDRRLGGALLVEARGTASNRDALGAKVTVQTASLRQTDEVRGGGGYASQSDFRLHFGVGDAERIDWIEVRWPSGSSDRFENVPVDVVATIVEGVDRIRTRPLRRSSHSTPKIKPAPRSGPVIRP